jgi:hypothetical protein
MYETITFTDKFDTQDIFELGVLDFTSDAENPEFTSNKVKNIAIKFPNSVIEDSNSAKGNVCAYFNPTTQKYEFKIPQNNVPGE